MVAAVATTMLTVHFTKSKVVDTLPAMIRAHPGSDMICYDGKQNAYFLHYLADTTDVDRWYYIDKVPFWEMSNKTIFTQKLSGDKYVITYPDVTGLPCKLTKEK
jgi:hypothetical protein